MYFLKTLETKASKYIDFHDSNKRVELLINLFVVLLITYNVKDKIL